MWVPERRRGREWRNGSWWEFGWKVSRSSKISTEDNNINRIKSIFKEKYFKRNYVHVIIMQQKLRKFVVKRFKLKENLYVVLQAEEITSQVESHRYRKESLMPFVNVWATLNEYWLYNTMILISSGNLNVGRMKTCDNMFGGSIQNQRVSRSHTSPSSFRELIS